MSSCAVCALGIITLLLFTVKTNAYVPSYMNSRLKNDALRVSFHGSEEYKRSLSENRHENSTDVSFHGSEEYKRSLSEKRHENSTDVSLLSFHGVEKIDNNNGQAATAPEVNTWTDIMSNGFLHDSNTNENEDGNEDVEALYQNLKDMSHFDREQVDRYWNELMPTVSYLGTEQVAKIWDALRVAYRAHRGQMRKSGEPFIIHPVEVALLLSGLKMDASTVMAGLLHDTVEDTDLTFSQIEAMFGHTVRSIVEGETKVSKLPKLAFSDSYADEQAENLRQMFVAMTDDYRIIIVKLADRLHNMRTLGHMKPEKQIKISRETLDIFA